MKIQLKRSSVLELGKAKPPSSNQMEYGEIALNFESTDPTLFYKDSTNAIRDVRLSLLPDMDNAAAQSGTLDDRYLLESGGTVSGNIQATQFVGGVVRISNTPPTAVAAGELWYNSDDGRTYIYYSDADSSQWVDMAPDTFELTQNHYTKTQSDARYIQIAGDTVTGTISFTNGTSAAAFSGPVNFDSANTTFGAADFSSNSVRINPTNGSVESRVASASDSSFVTYLNGSQASNITSIIKGSGEGCFRDKVIAGDPSLTYVNMTATGETAYWNGSTYSYKLEADGDLILEGNITADIPADTSTNADLPVLFQLANGSFAQSTGLTFNPSNDELKVSGTISGVGGGGAPTDGVFQGPDDVAILENLDNTGTTQFKVDEDELKLITNSATQLTVSATGVSTFANGLTVTGTLGASAVTSTGTITGNAFSTVGDLDAQDVNLSGILTAGDGTASSLNDYAVKAYSSSAAAGGILSRNNNTGNVFTGHNFSGATTSAISSAGNLTISGNVSAVNGTFTGPVSGTDGTFSGDVTGASFETTGYAHVLGGPVQCYQTNGNAPVFTASNQAVTFNTSGITTNSTVEITADGDAAFSGTVFCNDIQPTQPLPVSSLGNFADTSLYTFDSSGNFTATGNVTAFSDVKLKKNVEVIPDALDKVSQVRGVTFDRTDIKTPRQTGVIAQELEAVLPEAVITGPDGTKAVAYGNVIGLLIEAIKELQYEIYTIKTGGY
tara:strand:+ start:437 stop:2614 length:2178 start_codon:yes stop_codon:yes gene_type:complete